MNNVSSPEDQTIRLTLRWVVVAIIVMLAFGVLGGVLGSLWFSPALPPLTTTDGQQLVSTVQELTISPSIARADMVERARRSVVLVGAADADPPNLLGTAVAVTNDGLLATAASLPTRDLVVFDNDGRVLPVNRVGEDELFGITYLRLSNSVVVPINLRSENAPVGSTLTVLTGNESSFKATIADFLLESYDIPPGAAPAGLRQQLFGSPLDRSQAHYRGAPLLDEEGNLAGLLRDVNGGTAIPVSHVRESFDRVAEGRREQDPFTDLGFTVQYGFSTPRQGEPAAFTTTVIGVSPASRAASAGLRAGDVLVQVEDTTLGSKTNLAGLLSESRPLSVTIKRQEVMQTLTIPVAAE